MKPIMCLVHGLNLKPNKMNPLADIFEKLGFEVHSIVLYGHEDTVESQDRYLKASKEVWLKTFHDHYWPIYQKSIKTGVKLGVCGFSIGALISSFFNFDARIYFAPAWTLRTHIKFGIRAAKRVVGPKFNLRSRMTEEMRVNSYASLQTYDSVLQLSESFKICSNEESFKKTPTLVFMDPKDELVDYTAVKHHLSQLQTVQLHRLLGINESMKAKHHWIIGADATGGDAWLRTQTQIEQFLLVNQTLNR